jgi:hypothetical protein
LETFKLSTDPDFVAEVRDVVGLYVAPPERAIVLCVDEKSQIQALNRSLSTTKWGKMTAYDTSRESADQF